MGMKTLLSQSAETVNKNKIFCNFLIEKIHKKQKPLKNEMIINTSSTMNDNLTSEDSST